MRIDDETIRQIKASISTAKLAEEAGISLVSEGGHYKIRCPFHEEETPSCVVYDDDRGFYCYGCEAGGDVIKFIMLLDQCDFQEACLELAKQLGKTFPMDNHAATRKGRDLWPFTITSEIYEYPENLFEARYKNTRKRRKESALCRFVGDELVHGLKAGEYFQGSDGAWRRPKKSTSEKYPRRHFEELQTKLYRPEVWQSARDAGRTVLVTEGPKDAETAIALGFAATTSPNGSSGFRARHARELTDCRVAVLVDHDAPGIAGGEKRTKLLHGQAEKVRLVEPLGGEPGSGFDLTDWVESERRAHQRTDAELADELRRRIDAEPPWTPPPKEARSADGDHHEDARFTDVANAERFIARHGRDVRYCGDFKAWYRWMGHAFERDARGKVDYLAREVADVVLAEAAQEPDRKTALRLKAHASRILMVSRLRACLEAARVDPRIAVAPLDFDADPWLLNCGNGIVNLRVGTLEPHRASRRPLVTKTVAAGYDSEAACPRWERFLAEIFVTPEDEPDLELISWLKRAVGYSLTGSTAESVLVLLYGDGSNGKSLFLSTLATLFGGYNQALPFEALLERRGSSSGNPDVANLLGARMAQAVESSANSKWNEPLVKQLTGGDPITARRLYENPVTFEPTHKLWLATNHKPRTYDSSVAFWRRVMPVPFRVRFRKPHEYTPGVPFERAADLRLAQVLLAELPGILTWAIEGCLEWQRDGLGVCDAVVDARERYREEQDPLSAYLGERTVREPEERIAWKELWTDYKTWCESNDERALGSRTFGRMLDEHGIKPSKSNGIRTRVGIRLRTEFDVGESGWETSGDGSVTSDQSAETEQLPY